MFLMPMLFGYLTLNSAVEILGILAHSAEIPLWGLIVWFTAKRLPGRGSVQGITARVVAVAGTVLMLAIVIVPVAEIGPLGRVVSTLLTMLGAVWLTLQILRAL